jgi:hypothetical protein
MPDRKGLVLWRDELGQEQIPPTAFMEELLPDAMSSLLGTVDRAWLSAAKSQHVRLNDDYLTTPISFIGTTRIETNAPGIHYFARALLTAKDFLERRPEYDFHFGTIVIPELAKLGQILPVVLENVSGAESKVKSLYAGQSSEVRSTIYEILVAGASVLTGRSIRFEKRNMGKTPDLRVLDMEKLVIECKRKKLLTEYEQREEEIARAMFLALREKVRSVGLSGIVETEFQVELENADQRAVLAALSKLLAMKRDGRVVYTPWGKIAWHRLPETVPVSRTRLYGPRFLRTVFGWSDIPTHDGIVCQVEAPSKLVVEMAKGPVCLKWNSTSKATLLKKTRAVSALVGDANKQIPVGEGGIVYVCYNESARASIADSRTRLIGEQLSQWSHSSDVRAPLVFVNRLYATPVPNGSPDLIENVVKLEAHYAEPGLAKFFPAAVFTKPL